MFLFLAVLIGIACETGLLSAKLLWRADVVLILACSHLINPPLLFDQLVLWNAPRAACVPMTILDSGALPVW